MIDEYKTIMTQAEGLYREKGSKFIAQLFPVEDLESIQFILEELRIGHPKANHVCYAYRLGPTGEQYRANDDGEPSGTAGKPIYNELLSAEITDVLLTVVRYFGGTKLGASGLIQAYKSGSRDAISNSEIIQKYILKEAKIHFNHSQTGQIYNSLKKNEINIIAQELNVKNWIHVGARASKFDEMINNFVAHFHQTTVDHILHKSFQSSIEIEIL